MAAATRFTLILLMISVCASAANRPAFAQQRIGQAAVVRNQVARIERSLSYPIAAGDDVTLSELVRTGAASDARIAFIDHTSLSIGPVSTVTLDRFVFAPGDNYASAVLDLGRGLFRFLTGASNKRAYELVTPEATIGVRGTVLDVLVTPGSTLVTLQEGVAVVCPRSAGAPRESGPGCVTLASPRLSARVAGGVVRLTPARWTFAPVCDRDRDICGAPTFARAGICVAGSAPQGQCVDPDLARAVRRRAQAFGQSGASGSSPAYPPRNGRSYLIPGLAAGPLGRGVGAAAP